MAEAAEAVGEAIGEMANAVRKNWNGRDITMATGLSARGVIAGLAYAVVTAYLFSQIERRNL